jgi:nitrogen fixation NifU-like protein
MADLRDLYQQVILEHNRKPRNFREIAEASVTLEGTNPLCGDEIRLYVVLDDERILDVAFQGSGCAISQASASLMTTEVKGKTREEAEELFHAFHQMVTAPPATEPDTKVLGKLAALAGVRKFPARVKCANLAWHTLHGALAGGDAATSTE